MNYFLGVDAGGTKTHAVIIDENSNLLGEAIGGPANYHNLGIVEATSNVIGTIGQILEKTKLSLKSLTWCAVGITACDTKKDYERLYTAFSTGAMKEVSDKLTLSSDKTIALYSGTTPPGVVAICGTGSNVYGINQHGEKASAGNWGYFLGDKGSGYILAKRMFETIVATYDGIGEMTALTQKIEKRLNVTSSEDILNWYNDTQPSVHVISDFAPLVIEAAEEGDQIAKDLADKTIAEFGKSVHAVVRRLKMADEAVRLVISGGLFESKYFRALFEGHMTAIVKRVRIIKPLVSPAVGAALLGKHEWENKLT